MSREVRRVPPTWEHPKNERGFYIPLIARAYAEDVEAWDPTEGAHPKPDEYMPDWPESERTHYQMYESVSEGTPVSPVMPSLDEMARWLARNNVDERSYAEWLDVCKAGWAPTAYFRLL